MVLLEPYRRRPVLSSAAGERGGGGDSNCAASAGDDDNDNDDDRGGLSSLSSSSSPFHGNTGSSQSTEGGPRSTLSPLEKATSRSLGGVPSAPTATAATEMTKGSTTTFLRPNKSSPAAAAAAAAMDSGWKGGSGRGDSTAIDNASRLCADRRRPRRRVKGASTGGGGGSWSFWFSTVRNRAVRHWRRVTRTRPSWAATIGAGLAALALLAVTVRQVQLAAIQHHYYDEDQHRPHPSRWFHPKDPTNRAVPTNAAAKALTNFRVVFPGPTLTKEWMGMGAAGMRPLFGGRRPAIHERDIEENEEDEQRQRRSGPVPLPHRDFFGPVGPDYGGLHFDSMRFWTTHWFRVPYSDGDRWYEDERRYQLKEMDVETSSRHDHWDEMTHVDRAHSCHRMEWVDTQHQTCNLFHELHLGREPTTTGTHHHRHHKSRSDDPWEGVDITQPYHRKYLSHGYYRDSWLWEPVHSRAPPSSTREASSSSSKSTSSSPLGMENFVLKALRLNNHDLDYGWWTAHHMFKEALVMERTTASTRTMNIYGHCYTSLIVEQGFEISQRIVQGVEYHGRGRITQDDLDKVQANGTLASFNEFSAEEKLEIAIAMAEAIAEMHGHDEGVIVNDDVHPDQFLVNKHGQVKFNDMNNAHILDWNPANQSYCKWPIWIGGDYRSPEEMRGEPIDEKSDVWPMGALIFGLLTGLFPYYTEWEASKIERIIGSGEPPYLDPRWRHKSYIEGRMVEIMEKCFADKPEDRVSIFEVVLHLRVTAGFADVLRQQGKVDWSTKPAGLVPEVSIPSPEYEMYHTDDGGDDTSGDDHDDHPSDTTTTSTHDTKSGGGGEGGDAQGGQAAAGAPSDAHGPAQDDGGKRRPEGVRGARDSSNSRKGAAAQESGDDHLGEEQ